MLFYLFSLTPKKALRDSLPNPPRRTWGPSELAGVGRRAVTGDPCIMTVVAGHHIHVHLSTPRNHLFPKTPTKRALRIWVQTSDSNRETRQCIRNRIITSRNVQSRDGAPQNHLSILYFAGQRGQSGNTAGALVGK